MASPHLGIFPCLSVSLSRTKSLTVSLIAFSGRRRAAAAQDRDTIRGCPRVWWLSSSNPTSCDKPIHRRWDRSAGFAFASSPNRLDIRRWHQRLKERCFNGWMRSKCDETYHQQWNREQNDKRSQVRRWRPSGRQAIRRPWCPSVWQWSSWCSSQGRCLPSHCTQFV